MSSSLNLLLYMLSTICVQHSVSLRQYHVITHLKTLSFFTVIVLNVREQFSYICIWSRNIKVSRVPLKLTPGWLDYELVGWLAFNILSWWLLLFLSLSLSLSVSLLSSSFLVSLSFLILRCALESIFRFISVIGLGKGQVGSTAPIELGSWVQSLIHQRGRNQFIVGLLWCNMNSKVDFREAGFRGKKPNWN